MKQFILFLLMLATLAPVSTAAQTAAEAPGTPSLACDVGPVTRTYGGTEWLVYSCNDRRTVVIVSAPGNPGTPFYFALYPRDSGYLVVGEGNGDKSATGAAFAEIKALSSVEIETLIESTNSQ
jgi:hypothetical protein